jgi:membrane fusion protein (multidrug efflux system)
MSVRTLRFLAPVAGLLLTLSGCSKKAEAPAAPAVPEVSVAEVIQRDVPIGGELTATLRGFEDVELRARVEGYLRSIDFAEGTEVKKGKLLFTVDDAPYRAKLAEAKGELARAEATFGKADADVKRFTPLVEKRAISQAELDNAQSARRSSQAQMEAAKANVEKASLDLSYTKITAPTDGLVGKAERKVGDLVGKGEATLLTTLSSIDPIRVSVQIPEALYLRYANRAANVAEEAAKPAEKAAAKPAAAGEEQGPQLVLADGTVYPQRGKIVLVDRAVDPTTGTLRVDLGFPNPKRILRPGLYGKVKYREELRAGALLVPQRAVQELQGQFTVVVVNAEGKAETRKVKPGARTGSLWILEDGVKPGEKVIVEGAQKARDGAPVKATVVPAETPAAQPAPGAAPAAAGQAPAPVPAAAPAGQAPAPVPAAIPAGQAPPAIPAPAPQGK